MLNHRTRIGSAAIAKAAVCLTASLCFAVPGAAQDQTLQPIQVMQMKSVTGVYLSPDGKTLAFTRTSPRLAEDRPGSSYNHLYVMSSDGGEERLLVGGKRSVSGVAFSPDSKYITVRRRGESDLLLAMYDGMPGDGEAFVGVGEARGSMYGGRLLAPTGDCEANA